MKTIFEDTIIQKTKRIIWMEEIEGTDFAVYREEREHSINGEVPKKTIQTGITSKKNLEEVQGLDRIDEMVYAPGMYEEQAVVACIRKEDFERVKAGEMHITDAVYRPYEIKEDIKNCKLVLWSVGSHKIADLHYNPISLPVRMGYMNGISNQNYDLDGLLKNLKQDVCVLNRESLCISPIPHYNADDENTHSIEFQYLLSDKDYAKIADKGSLDMAQYIQSHVQKIKECKIEEA